MEIGNQQFAVARSMIASGNPAATRAQLDELAPKYRKDPGYHALNAESFETEGQYSKAESDYRLALHEAPVDFKIHHPLGFLSWREGELNEGAEELRQAAAADSHDAGVHFDLGRLLIV